MTKTNETLIEEVNTLLSRMGVLLEEIRSLREELSAHLVTETGNPDWSDAPEWAICRAQDMCGAWYWYEKEPIALDDSWYDLNGGLVRLAAIGNPNSNWQYTLEERPDFGPRWEDAPEWVGWRAQDKNGEWWWFEAKPLANHDTDCWRPWYWTNPDERVMLAGRGKYNPNWEDTLEERPD